MGSAERLSDMDSNHDKCLQRAVCYHYTIGQAASKLAFGYRERKGKLTFSPARTGVQSTGNGRS